MSKIPPQYTTEPNNMPAPLWAGEGLYWNPEYLAYAEKRNATEAKRAAEFVYDRMSPEEWNRGGVMDATPRTCPVCDRPLPHDAQSHQVVHSGECQRKRRVANHTKAQARRRASKLKPRSCEVCKAEYQPIKGTQKTCSDACRDIRIKGMRVESNRRYRERQRSAS